MKRIRVGLLLVLGAVFLLSGCGGGSGGSTANVTTPGTHSIAASISTSVPVSACPTGGIAVNTGIDTNGNGVLDASEITNTQYVCNGTAAANALMSVTDEPAGSANCAAGGKKISVGLDTNTNGTLDAVEVTSSTYICNGASGINGLNTLVSTTGEAPGANCVYGGLKVNSGLDSNSNGSLDAGEITNTSYACNVSAGSGGFTWVDVTASSVQAASNMGYMANSASQVVVTLPVAPAIGDVVKVSGIGAGGWKVAANAGQSIATDNLGSNATAALGAMSWNSIAASADGSKLVAGSSCGDIYCNFPGRIFTSGDAGATWTWQINSPLGIYQSVASSADGSKLVAAARYADSNLSSGTQISTSADGGATWTLQANSPLANWSLVVSSIDGSKLVAVTDVTNANQIYVSTDGGVNWTLRNTLAGYVKVAMSADGSKLVATVAGGQIYTSADSGVTWVLQAGSPVAFWNTVASSADGLKLVAASFSDATGLVGGSLYTSVDGGVTWSQSTGPGAKFWISVTSAADGSKLAATINYGNVMWVSADGGATWLLMHTNDSAVGWRAIVSSADGSKLAAVSDHRIYTSADSGANWVFPLSTPLLQGRAHSSIELQYIGSNSYLVLNSAGTIYY